MAELSGWPTDGAEGSVSSEARWRKMARLWAPSGVANGLVPTLGAGVINVTAGSVWIDGHYAELTSPASESSSANGLLVVRFTPADNLFELVYRDGVTTPTQSDAVWELPIARMTAGAMTDVRAFTSGGSGWQPWTPTLSNLNVGSTGVVTARYAKADNGTVAFYFRAALAGTGISVGSVVFSAPVNMSAAYATQTPIGDAAFVDAAPTPATFMGFCRADSPTQIRPVAINPATGAHNNLSSTSPHTWAGTDIILCTGVYEAAA